MKIYHAQNNRSVYALSRSKELGFPRNWKPPPGRSEYAAPEISQGTLHGPGASRHRRRWHNLRVSCDRSANG
jgi:hypothetical protein